MPNSIINIVKDFTGLNSNETDEDGLFTFEAVECIGACGGSPAMQVNYETVEGLSSENTLNLCEWLKNETPDLVVADELQNVFVVADPPRYVDRRFTISPKPLP